MSYELHSKGSIRDTSYMFSIFSSEYGVLYGFVFCRQLQDEQLPRGGEQRSVVVVSPYPLSSLLSPFTQYAGPEVLNCSADSVESTLSRLYAESQQWPLLEWGSRMTFSLGTTAILVELPELASLPAHCLTPVAQGNSSLALDLLVDELDIDLGLNNSLLPQAPGQHELVTVPFGETDIYSPFQNHVELLWTAWELLLLGEPFMVHAPTPQLASTTVVALASLLAPIPYCLPQRPYFTIHDPLFGELASCQGSTTSYELPRLIGLTNQFIVKSLSLWPNLLSTGHAPRNGSEEGKRWLRIRKQNGCQDYVKLAYKGIVKPDRQVIESLIQPLPNESVRRSRAAMTNSAILRRHFQEITKALLFPLLPLISPTPPDEQSSPESLDTPPALPTLEVEAVLQGLRDKSARIPDILLQRFGNQKSLALFYERFLMSPLLRDWLRVRQESAAEWQRLVWRNAWRAAGGPLAKLPSSQGTKDVAAVEKLFTLEQHLEALEEDTQEYNCLLCELKAILDQLPTDLQQSLLLNPKHQRLINSTRHLD